MRSIAGMAFGISAHPYSVAMRWQGIETEWQNFATTFFKKFLTPHSRFLIKACSPYDVRAPVHATDRFGKFRKIARAPQ